MLIRIKNILDEILVYNPKAVTEIIEKAYVYSAAVSSGQLRLSGEPILVRALTVAYITTKMRLDVPAVVAALLHEIIEKKLVSYDDIKNNFNTEIATILEVLNKIEEIVSHSTLMERDEKIAKITRLLNKDIRILLVKLAERLYSIRTLEFRYPNDQYRIAKETLDIYAPLANQLGIHWLSVELEDLGLRYIEPEEFAQVSARLDETVKNGKSYLTLVIERLRTHLEKHGIKCKVQGRKKNVYSVYQKLKLLGTPYRYVYDVLGVTVLVDTTAECYSTLEIIHSIWEPIQSKIRDFIATPKANMYQALHTTVFDQAGEMIEMQIRTMEMDVIANEGILYKMRHRDRTWSDKIDFNQDLQLHEALAVRGAASDQQHGSDIINMDVYPDEVYVYTPQRKVMVLPLGSTILDFSRTTHSGQGFYPSEARVNGKRVPPDYRLRDGDVVDIVEMKTIRV
jgi:GTP diphosphokinase / guanosine-3',5'-bis(diphosphate) 3'-diphosphatase